MVYNRVSWLNAMSKVTRVDLEHEDAPVLNKYSIAEFRDLLREFSKVEIIPERFPVASRLHKRRESGPLQHRLRRRLQRAAEEPGPPLRLAPDGALRQSSVMRRPRGCWPRLYIMGIALPRRRCSRSWPRASRLRRPCSGAVGIAASRPALRSTAPATPAGARATAAPRALPEAVAPFPAGLCGNAHLPVRPRRPHEDLFARPRDGTGPAADQRRGAPRRESALVARRHADRLQVEPRALHGQSARAGNCRLRPLHDGRRRLGRAPADDRSGQRARSDAGRRTARASSIRRTRIRAAISIACGSPMAASSG